MTEAPRPLRIVFLNSWYPDPVRGSGTTAAIETFAGGLRSLGHEVVTLDSETAPRRAPLPFMASRVLYNLRAPGALRDLDPPPDIVIGFDADGVLVHAGARPFPYIVALKGVAADEARFERGWPKLQLSTLGRLERRNTRRANLVIVPSAYSAGVVADTYGVAPERIAVVPEAIDPAPWQAIRAGPRPEPPRRPTVLTVGRQYPRKNTRTLIQALAAVRPEIPDVRLRVIGGGPCLPDLRGLTRKLEMDDVVAFEGAVPGSGAVRRAYLEADIFAMPSLQEGFGIVFLEAMAAGIPVVAGRAGAAPEVVIDGDTGLLTDPLDPTAIAEAIVGLLGDPERRQRMGARGIERAQRFTPQAAASTFLARVAAL